VGPCVNNMSEKSNAEVIEFKTDDSNTTAVISDDNVKAEKPIPASQTNEPPKVKADTTPKSFTWMSVKFPPYFVGPHFVQVKGSFVMAIDPACVSMEMRTNWQTKYIPELAALGKKVLEKNLKIKIENLG